MYQEAREGLGGATEYQVGDTTTVVYPMTEGTEHDIDLRELDLLLIAQGE